MDEQRKHKQNQTDGDTDDGKGVIPAARFQQPAKQRREDHRPQPLPCPVDAQRDTHVAHKPARHDHRQQHAERRVTHGTHEKTIHHIEVPQLADGTEHDGAAADQQRRKYHYQPCANAVAQPAHQYHGRQAHQKRQRITERNIAALPAEFIDQRVDKYAERGLIGARDDVQHEGRSQHDPRVVNIVFFQEGHERAYGKALLNLEASLFFLW